MRILLFALILAVSCSQSNLVTAEVTSTSGGLVPFTETSQTSGKRSVLVFKRLSDHWGMYVDNVLIEETWYDNQDRVVHRISYQGGVNIRESWTEYQ